MSKEDSLSLIFVYNANSGAKNALLDSMHKVFSPSTYECSLCNITFGLVGENQVWKKFRQESDHKMEFLHRDEFQKKYASKFGHKFTFPVVLVQGKNELELFISTQELNALTTSKELKGLINQRAR
ncbi:GTPase [Muricauda sp. JGD-17]|uniref:GTPase n=1 Tax=Flagellimonas ochracea TaxID=2696472 RepID=A0A964WYA2_9FLAO|nr:GTPase [Allomuricauda ochracea]